MLRSLKFIAIAAAALSAAVAFGLAQTAPPAPAPILTSTARFLPVIAKNGMVASQEKLATHVGVEILKEGGNAIDAAVAVGFALAVTHPQAGNIGGGGFMLVHLAARNETVAIDYRETAPAAQGQRAFYEGEIADKIVTGVRTNGGIISHDDLKNYRAIVRPAVRGTYRGYGIASMPPPSSGGVHLIQILNILEGFPLREA